MWGGVKMYSSFRHFTTVNCRISVPRISSRVNSQRIISSTSTEDGTVISSNSIPHNSKRVRHSGSLGTLFCPWYLRPRCRNVSGRSRGRSTPYTCPVKSNVFRPGHTILPFNSTLHSTSSAVISMCCRVLGRLLNRKPLHFSMTKCVTQRGTAGRSSWVNLHPYK
jgi:hypothetical protein